jgi:hypothetical protein
MTSKYFKTEDESRKERAERHKLFEKNINTKANEIYPQVVDVLEDFIKHAAGLKNVRHNKKPASDITEESGRYVWEFTSETGRHDRRYINIALLFDAKDKPNGEFLIDITGTSREFDSLVKENKVLKVLAEQTGVSANMESRFYIR